jgi:FkbM family methyltransferase
MTSLAKGCLSVAAYAGHLAAGKPGLRRMVFNAIRLNRIETERFRQSDELRFLAYAFANRHRSKSQILQDLWVCYELEEKHGGVFVEFGATNGLTNSNSWLLEERYGWTGILAEPNPIWHADLRRNRSSAIDLRCVHARSGETVMFTATDDFDPELSCLSEFASGDHFARIRANGREFPVETVSLNQLLDDHRAPREIDYMSIDTEGSEYAILSAFDFSRHSVTLISVEQNPTTEGPIETLLAARGYVRVFQSFSQWDGWYVRDARTRMRAPAELEPASAAPAPIRPLEALKP